MGKVRVSLLSNKRAKQINPMLAWEMLHKFYHMYHNIKSLYKTGIANRTTSTLSKYMITDRRHNNIWNKVLYINQLY